MSSLLRSTKFVRYFCGAARTLILNSARNVETNLLINSKSLSAANNVILRDYATTKKAENLEPLLQSMDTEIRRNGRITKKSIEELFEGIKTKNAISSSQSLLVIRCCGDILSEEVPQKRTQLVQQIWTVLTNIGVQMDISHYNTLLRVYIENEHPFSPAEFLEELQNKGLQPNHVTYQRLMWRYCQQGDIDGATKVLENMRELGMPITVPVLNALVMGHSNLGDTEGAKSVLATVSGTGLQPSNFTYALLACGYARKGDLDGVQSVLKTVNEADIIMTNKDIFSIIEAFAVNGHSDKIDTMMGYLTFGPSYGPDAYNAILHLINKGQENVAKTILKTFRKTEENSRDAQFYEGAFFIKQLLKVKQSPQDIVDLCRELKEEGLVQNGILVALGEALNQGNADLAQYIIAELKQNGIEVRQHYYWPLLVQKGKEGDEEGLLQILRNISSDGYTPSKETLANYVMPYLKDDPQNVVAKLQLANVPTALAARTVAANLLQSNKIKEAATICLIFKLRGNSFIKEYIIGALGNTHDIESFTTILQIVNRGIDVSQIENAQVEDQIATEKDEADLDLLIRRAVKVLKTPALCESLLSSLLNKGIGINSESATFIQNFFGSNLTTNISDTLAKLTAPDLAVTPLPRFEHAKQRSSVQLELLIKYNEQKGKEVLGLKTQLLHSYIKDGDSVKTKQLLDELKSEKYQFNANTLSQIVEYYCENNELVKALQYKDMLSTTYPDFKLNDYKVISLALALAKADKFDEVLLLLRSNESDGGNTFILNNKCWQLLNLLAEQKDPEKLKQVFDILVENKFAEPSNVLLGPLIKVHLLREDLDSALAQFEFCCKQYRSSPWKGELMKQLIVTENATKLQWLADLATEIHGEVNVLYDLVMAFIECGRLRQARRILETPGLHMRNQRIDIACKRYVNVGMTDCLEGLLEATKELSNVDRSTIFNHLLASYIKIDETDKALGLWNKMQEDGEVPTDDFLATLGQHLKSKNLQVPFVMPETSVSSKPVPKQRNDVVKSQFDQEISDLIQKGNNNEAFNVALKCLKSGIKPGRHLIANLLRNLMDKAEVEKILLLKPYYEKEKKPINYMHKLTLATVMSGSGSRLVDELQLDLKNASQPEDIDALLPRFPRADALNILLKDEDLQIKCEEMAKMFFEKGRHLPANLLWMEYLINGQEKKADDIWNKYLCDSSFIKFKRLLQFAHDNKQLHLMEKLLGYLNGNSKLKPEARGNVYSRLINYHIKYNNDTEKANELVKRALSEGLQLNHINDTAWKSFKKACEANGETFTYELK